MSKTSELIQDLNSVPSIVGALGLSIAAAQKAFNLDYLSRSSASSQLSKCWPIPRRTVAPRLPMTKKPSFTKPSARSSFAIWCLR